MYNQTYTRAEVAQQFKDYPIVPGDQVVINYDGQRVQCYWVEVIRINKNYITFINPATGANATCYLDFIDDF